MRNCTYLTLLWGLFSSALVFGSPNSLTYQGRILKSDGTPLEYNNVSFVFQVTDPSGACVIYQEQVNGYNMANSGGVFDVPIGSGSVSFPTTPGFYVLDAFNNSSTLQCSGGSTYAPSVGDTRKLRVQFHDGTGWKLISPDSVIRSVPFAGYALSAQKLGTNVASDFVTKAGLPTCGAGTFLTWDGTSLTCSAVAGASGGTVTNVSSANSYLTVANGASTPTLTLNVGTTANTVAAGNDSRLVNALQSGSAAAGDLSGNYPAPSVVALQGVAISVTAPSSGQFFKYNGTNWGGSAIAISDVTNLSTQLSTYLTQSAFNSYVSAAGCAASETMYWNSVSSNFACKAINVSLAGDVTGSIGASKVVALQNKNVAATAPTNGQVLQWNGTTTQWEPTTLPAGNYVTDLTGDVTATGPGSAAATVAKLQGKALTITTPAASDYLKYNGTAFVNSPLAAADLTGTVPVASIPSLDWSKIATGKPTTLTGYGITDAVKNAGNALSIQAGADASKGAATTNGRFYFATDTSKIYYDNGTSWVQIASNVGSGGTITALTSDVSASGTGSVAATVNSVGGVTAANVASGANAANAATNANTASTIVKRDASGNFSAGTITANLTGNVTGNVTGSASLNVLKAGDSMTGNLTFASGKGTVFTDSTANTVSVQAPTTVTSYVLKLPAAQGSANQLLTNDGSGNLSWTSLSSLGVTSVSVTSPITNSGSATAPNIGIQQANGSQNGYLSSSDWTTFNNKQSTSLTSANIWVGNGSNTATAVAPSGDVSMTNAGAFTVTGLRGKTVSATAPSAAGQVLRYDGTSTYAPAFLGLADIRATITPFGGAFANSACTAGQSMYWQSSTDTFQCQSIAINDSQLSFTTSRAANTFLAAPNGSAGAASFRTIASADLPSTGANGVYLNGGNSFGAASSLGNNDNYDLSIKTNNANRLTVQAGGNVGVGTTAPISALQVAGTATFGTGGASAGSTGNVQITGSPGSPVSGRLTFGTDATDWNFRIAKNQGGTVTDLVNVDTNGGVGIGAYATTQVPPANGLAVSGNVGIGTSAPSSQLHMAGVAPYVTFEETDTSQKFFSGVDGSHYWIRQGSTANPDLVTVLPSGNVGVGTTTPSQKLEVSGNAKVTGNLFGSVKDTAGNALRACTGTSPNNTWVYYSNNAAVTGSCGAYIDINTSACGFTTVFKYFPSMGGGSGQWGTTGATSVYSPTATGFRIYVNALGSFDTTTCNSTTLPHNTNGWFIDWLAVGM